MWSLPAPPAWGGDDLEYELTGANATDSQSPQSAIHNIIHLDKERGHRPVEASTETKLAHWAIAALLSSYALFMGYRKLTEEPADQLLYFGCIVALMLIVSPVSHVHYYAFILPLASGLWAKSLSLRPGQTFADKTTFFALAGWGVGTALPLLPWPFFVMLLEIGFGTLCTILLILFGLHRLGSPRIGRAITPA